MIILPVSAVNVFSNGDLAPGLHNLTVPSEELERSCVLELCIDRPHTASVWPVNVSCSTLGSEISKIHVTIEL